MHSGSENKLSKTPCQTKLLVRLRCVDGCYYIGNRKVSDETAALARKINAELSGGAL